MWSCSQAGVLACWNMMIPYLCPDLPDAQKEALKYGVKVPLVYTSVALRNWTAFKKLGINGASTPGMYHTGVRLEWPTVIGGYNPMPTSPEDPVLVRMTRTPCARSAAAIRPHHNRQLGRRGGRVHRCGDRSGAPRRDRIDRRQGDLTCASASRMSARRRFRRRTAARGRCGGSSSVVSPGGPPTAFFSGSSSPAATGSSWDWAPVCCAPPRRHRSRRSPS
jgi:hypothetical protein